jgi:hypothetical protein
MLALPLVIAGIVTAVWHAEAPHLLWWSLPYMAAHTSAQLLGGLTGIAFGRPLARLAVRIILPHSIRPRLAYLWLADELSYPSRVEEPSIE